MGGERLRVWHLAESRRGSPWKLHATQYKARNENGDDGSEGACDKGRLQPHDGELGTIRQA